MFAMTSLLLATYTIQLNPQGGNNNIIIKSIEECYIKKDFPKLSDILEELLH